MSRIYLILFLSLPLCLLACNEDAGPPDGSTSQRDAAHVGDQSTSGDHSGDAFSVPSDGQMPPRNADGGDPGSSDQGAVPEPESDAGVGVTDAGAVDPPNPADCVSDQVYFEAYIWPIMAGRCVGCHRVDGIAGDTVMAFMNEGQEGWLNHNFEQARAAATLTIDDEALLLMKPTGRIPHTGGSLVDLGTPEFEHFESFVGRVLDEIDDCGVSTVEVEPDDDECVELGPGRRLLRRLSHVEYQNTIRDLLGIDFDARGAFVADTHRHGFENHPEELFVSPLLMTQYQQASESIAEQIDVASLLPCELIDADASCGHSFIAQFGLRAFRRPLSAEEIESYRTLFNLVVEQECFEQAVRWVVVAILQSPHFLYRTELGRDDGERFSLTPYEIATALSYLTWQTMPDEQLFELARTGEILDPDILNEELTRLLEDPRSTRMAFDFVQQWLEIRSLLTVVRDSEVYAALYFELRESMMGESWHFVREAWESDQPLAHLFTADESWIDQQLADYYLFDLPQGGRTDDGFGLVDVSFNRPAGILTQGAFLTTHAAPTSSSPIHRGVIVRERILCEELPPPPEGLDIQPPPFNPNLSTRERFAAHTQEMECFGCHRLIDDIGFGFENYDGIGRHRLDDNGIAIDAEGTLVRTMDADVDFDGVGGLAQLLSEDAQVKACYATQWLRFTIGDTEGLDTNCYQRAMTAAGEQDGFRLQHALKAVVNTPHFLQRLGEPGELDVPSADRTPVAPNEPVAGPDPAVPPPNLPALACGVPPDELNGPNLNAQGLDVAVREDRWQTGYCAYYTLTNTSNEPIEWAIRVAVDGQINNSWNCNRDAASGQVTFSGVQWNQLLQPNQQADFGFCADL